MLLKKHFYIEHIQYMYNSYVLDMQIYMKIIYVKDHFYDKSEPLSRLFTSEPNHGLYKDLSSAMSAVGA